MILPITSVPLFFWAFPCYYLHVIIFPPTKHFVSPLSICLYKFIYTKSEVQGLVTGYWPLRPGAWDSELSLPQPDFNLCPGNQNPFFKLLKAESPEIKRFITSYNEQLYILQKQQLLKITISELVKMSPLTIKNLYVLMKILIFFLVQLSTLFKFEWIVKFPISLTLSKTHKCHWDE